MRTIQFPREQINVIYDFAKYGGAISTINLASFLPNNITPVMCLIGVDTTLASGGAATIAIGESGTPDTAFFLPATGFGAFTAGARLPGHDFLGTPKKISNASQVTITIAGAALTAGRMTISIEYLNQQPK